MALGYVTNDAAQALGGDGYEYLTRQVAALDSTEKGTTPLADYYTAKGEAPGRWVGSGLVSLDGLVAGDTVTAEQMKHLFGMGAHPLTGQPLGSPYKIYGTDGVDGFNVEVGLRLGRNPSGAERARVRSEVAREFFVADHGREPRDARELSAALARYSRPRQTSVAGYDRTFSPVKSVSALWAVAPPQVARLIERAHDAAVADARRPRRARCHLPRARPALERCPARLLRAADNPTGSQESAYARPAEPRGPPRRVRVAPPAR